MKLELRLIDQSRANKPQFFDVDLPAVPRTGEVILVSDGENYEVSTVTYHFDADGRFTGRISVDAESLWNCKPEK